MSSIFDDRRQFFESLTLPDYLKDIQKHISPFDSLTKPIYPNNNLQEILKGLSPSQGMVNALEILSPNREIQKAIGQMHNPLYQFQENIRRIASPIAEAVQSFTEHQKSLSFYFKGLSDIVSKVRASNKLESSGWMAHYTTPFHLIDFEEDSSETISTKVATYYEHEWESVRAAFEKMMRRLDVDDEAKEAFIEALRCHEGGNYRATCRLLFPEVERLSRIYFYPDEPMKRMASVEVLQDFAGSLTSDQIQPRGYINLMLFGKLVEHLYTHVNTPEDIAHIKNDPVPNRHAAIHGYITYSTAQNSINALIMTDFLFQVLTVYKSESVREYGESSKPHRLPQT